MDVISEFRGFPQDSLDFLKALAANNHREWFAANRSIYESAYKQPAVAFGNATAAQLEKLTKKKHMPKIFRINRDLRFSKDQTPYNTHLHISFVPQVEAEVVPMWFFGLDVAKLTVGVGVFDFGKHIESYRKRVEGEAGADLAKQLQTLTDQGLRMEEPGLKRVPSGYPADHPRADLLRRKGLAVWSDFPKLRAATQPDIVDECIERFRQVQPVFDWLMRVGGGR